MTMTAAVSLSETGSTGESAVTVTVLVKSSDTGSVWQMYIVAAPGSREKGRTASQPGVRGSVTTISVRVAAPVFINLMVKTADPPVETY